MYKNYNPIYFTLPELCHSNTAVNERILNAPTFSAVDNLKRLIYYILDPVRIALDSPIYVTSGYRTSFINRLVGGVSNSQHTLGLAVDIYAKDMKKLHELLSANKHFDQLITETNKSGFTWYHVSIAPEHSQPRQMIFNIKK